MPLMPAKAKAANGQKTAGGSTGRSRRSSMPAVKLGSVEGNGIAAAMYGLIDRGAHKRPKIAKGLRGRVEIRFKEDFAPCRMTFAPREIVVEDAPTPKGGDKPKPFKPDLVISGGLPDITQLAAAPLVGALASVAGGKVKIEGSPLLARRVMKLLEV
jgi:hypothetical protein